MLRGALVLALFIAPAVYAAGRPNVLLIVTDDQGYGDLGCHANPKIRTPNLDRLAAQSVRLTRFYVSPVCSPTRSSLMTGRWNYRTGVVDTYLGRSLMRLDEKTAAELLRSGGYRTGIFGKWHLGDNYPLRPQDRGFEEALVCKGGGLTQPSDPPGNSYFDPILMHNGKAEKTHGYCSDVFAAAALRFIEQPSEKPFFVYLAFNAPHDPLQVDPKLVEPYLKMNLAASEFPQVGQPVLNPAPREQTARVYAMIENIDANVGRLLQHLDERKLSDNTVVIFLSDNGPAQPRFNGGLRGLKGSVFEGGIRVPCFVRWPAMLRAGSEVEVPTAHVDILPTLLAMCDHQELPHPNFDGRDLMALLTGRAEAWPTRSLFFQWHRGDVPQKNRAFAVIGPRYKLVQPSGGGTGREPNQSDLQLFDLASDPFEQRNVAAQHEEIVRSMQREYATWFDDVSARGFDPPQIHLGSDAENPATLTRQDWRGPRAGWQANDLGYWEVFFEREAAYTITARFAPRADPGKVRLRIGQITREQALPAKATEAVFRAVQLPRGDARLETWLEVGAVRAGANFVEIERP
jgi:arylsulfatase A-like enzyme